MLRQYSKMKRSDKMSANLENQNSKAWRWQFGIQLKTIVLLNTVFLFFVFIGVSVCWFDDISSATFIKIILKICQYIQALLMLQSISLVPD